MNGEAPDFPPLWSDPAPIGHNGGPPIASRKPGRPSISTPELRDRILNLLAEGVPLRVISRTPGMPSRRTIYNWRQDDPQFHCAFEFMQTEGYIGLAEKVVEEVDTILEKRGPEIARWVFNMRRQQLSRMNPRYFGDRGMKC